MVISRLVQYEMGDPVFAIFAKYYEVITVVSYLERMFVY